MKKPFPTRLLLMKQKNSLQTKALTHFTVQDRLRDMFKDMKKEEFYWSLGGGFRLTIPGLPIGFYFVKRYKYDEDGSIDWQDGVLFKNSMKLDFVIGFNQSYY